MSSAFLLYAAYAVIIVETTPNPQTRNACLIVGLSMLLNPAVLFRAWFQAQVAAKYGVMAQLLGFSIGAGARIYLLWKKEATVFALAWILVCELALNAILVASVYGKFRQGQAWRWRWSGAYARQWASEAWTQLLSGLAIFVYIRDRSDHAGEDGRDSVGRHLLTRRQDQRAGLLYPRHARSHALTIGDPDPAK